MRIGRDRAAFTLIELLIVIFIISILVAVAVPNFIEAQTRAKISRVKTDLRTIAQALEAYGVDHNNQYPYPHQPCYESLSTVYELSTPVAYLATVMLLDPFPHPWLESESPPAYRPTYQYDNYSGAFGVEMHKNHGSSIFTGYCLFSVGPDKKWNSVCILPFYINEDPRRESKCVDLVYDPSNGTVSSGDIARWTGKPMKYGNH